MKTKHLLIMAAGTGGHIFPGLAIAHTMRERGWKISWLGTTQGMECEIVAQQEIELDAIEFSGLRGKGWIHTLSGIFRLCKSFISCYRIMQRRKPDVVLGMGGYVTVPGGFMARLYGARLVLLNADAGILLSNKILAPVAHQILFGFAPVEPADITAQKSAIQKNKTRTVVTGNPVRTDILAILPAAQRYSQRTGSLRILVMGGSLGAKVLNDCLPQALAQIPAALRPIVTHQSGAQHIDALRKAYAALKIEAEIVPFINHIAQAYAQADLVICRAGAITVSELTAAGVASILVPFLASTTTHQYENACWLSARQGAFHLPQTELTPEKLAALLMKTTRTACLNMAQKAYAQGKPEANMKIATLLEGQALLS